MTKTHGLCTPRPRTCVCGVVFEARKATTRYCSDACRLANSRFGRSYGQKRPPNMKVWRA